MFPIALCHSPPPASSGGTAPTVAPVLEVAAELGSYIAELTWTASNKTTSPGFTYEVYMQVDGGGFSLIESTTATFTTHDAASTAGDYEFYIKPVNDIGEGPDSNVAEITLPGESEDQFRLIEDGTDRLLEDDSLRLLESAP